MFAWIRTSVKLSSNMTICWREPLKMFEPTPCIGHETQFSVRLTTLLKKSVKLLRPFHKKFNLHHLWGFFVHFYIHKYLRVIQLKKENMSLFFSKRIVSHFYYITSLCTNPGSLIQSLIIIKNKISAKEGHSTGFLSYYTKMLYDMRGSNKK